MPFLIKNDWFRSDQYQKAMSGGSKRIPNSYFILSKLPNGIPEFWVVDTHRFAMNRQPNNHSWSFDFIPKSKQRPMISIRTTPPLLAGLFPIVSNNSLSKKLGVTMDPPHKSDLPSRFQEHCVQRLKIIVYQNPWNLSVSPEKFPFLIITSLLAGIG